MKYIHCYQLSGISNQYFHWIDLRITEYILQKTLAQKELGNGSV